MAWVKIDDMFADHPKVIEAGREAGWLFVCGLCYCGRYLTDGFIPAGQVRKLTDQDNTQELAQRLVAVRLWEQQDGGYRIHDYLKYNPSRKKVLADRELKAQRQAKWREKREAEDGLRDALQDRLQDRPVTPAPSPSPNPHELPIDTRQKSAATPGANAPAAVKRTRKKPERGQDEAALMSVFLDATGLHMPRTEKDINWWFAELRGVLPFVDNDPARAKALVRQVVADMRGRNPPLTITSPKSIVGMANSLAGGNGTDGVGRSDVPDWVEQGDADLKSGKLKVKVPNWIGGGNG